MKDLKKGEITRELITAYWMEIEAVMNYVCNSVNLDGMRAEEVKKALATDVQEELGHAQALAQRIHELEGTALDAFWQQGTRRGNPRCRRPPRALRPAVGRGDRGTPSRP